MNRFVLGFGMIVASLAPGAHAQTTDYPGALWNPAYSGNFQTSTRPTAYPIEYVVIHIMEGTYSGSISWFQNPSSNVSAHYCIRSSDGQITQMVREKDIAWHAGITFYNQRSVGIEHEATSTNPSWYTTNMYESSARLTRSITSRHNIPRTRTRIIGHRETGRATICPGDIWNWDTYMAYVTNDAQFNSATFPIYLNPNQQIEVVVRFQNMGLDSWSNLGTDRVLLSTASPVDRVSPFATPSWVANNRAAAPTAITAPSTEGEFRFTIKAPATVGNYTEAFQLYRSSIGHFGPVVSFNIGVGAYDAVVDNSDPGFVATGSWSTGTTAAGKYGADYRFNNATMKTPAKADWFLNAPADGYYDVYAWWSQGTNRSKTVTYAVDDLIQGTVTRTMDQTVNGGQWNKIARVRLPLGGGMVHLTPSSKGPGSVVIADAVRLVGPF